MLRNPHVSFEADFGTDDEFPHPPGCAIARRLVAGLKRQGLSPGEIENWRDVGWEIPCAVGSAPTYLFFSFMGRGPRQWLLCCTSRRRIRDAVAELCGRQTHQRERRRLAQAVHSVLVEDKRFSEVRWYSGPKFTFKEGDAWSPKPD